MSSSNSLALNLSKKFHLLRKIYLYYNIYIRNFKFFFKSSQFGEDKKIIKLFNRKGIYLDVGCFHPIRHNNTYLMYKLGWRGINIDLNPLSIELFNIARPEDINICAAISDKIKFRNLYFDHELSTLNTLEKSHTLFLGKLFGLKNLKKKRIKTQNLNFLLKKKKIKKIDFFNIDIEGHELKVLKSLNFNYFDIKVICVEIVNYDTYTKNIKNNRNEIFRLLKKKNYSLKFKSVFNYIFIKKKVKN